MKKTADEWFAAYGADHQHRTNELIHWISVPVLFFCLLGFVWTLPVPVEWIEAAPWFNWSLVAIALTSLFYLWVSPALSAGMLFFMSLCYTGLVVIDVFFPWSVWQVCVGLFLAAWGAQFIGHSLEGRPISGLNDLRFLFVAPAWLLTFVYRRMGQRY